MTPDEAIEKARWYEREDIATTLREEANVLADEVERLRERVGVLEEALREIAGYDLRAEHSESAAHEIRDEARAALKGSP